MDRWEVHSFPCLPICNPPTPLVTAAPTEHARPRISRHPGHAKTVDNPTPPSIHRSGVRAYAELRDGPAGNRRPPTPLPATSACRLCARRHYHPRASLPCSRLPLAPTPPHCRPIKRPSLPRPFPHHTPATFHCFSPPQPIVGEHSAGG
ncbi:hypothetical protein E2562_031150 [Oryza meyeriana var. granulata]|uniref:Uncharacterized protein n=1 Tax=Oryza meyeriana var. granulata TaxID=110450 RepID=A0A6G1FEG6_9ORYZ|nr:hypothetical protein E2562_031150 [Oryza meyeriana var. granulata]